MDETQGIYENGRLFHLAEEPVFKARYTALLAFRQGPVAVEEVSFLEENGHVRVLAYRNDTVEDITPQLDFCTTGQPLVRQGQVVPLEQIAEQWSDPRHLVRPVLLDFHGDPLYPPNAQLQRGLLRKALVGPVHLRLEARVDEQTRLPLTLAGWVRMKEEDPEALGRAEAFLRSRRLLELNESLQKTEVLLRIAQYTEQLLREALKKAEYHVVEDSRPLSEGEYRFLNEHLEIFLRKAIYPHNVLVRWANGDWGFVVWPGESGWKGVTLPEAQRYLVEELGVEDALLIDNGSDCRLNFRGVKCVFPREDQDRPEISSLLVVSLPPGAALNGITVS